VSTSLPQASVHQRSNNGTPSLAAGGRSTSNVGAGESNAPPKSVPGGDIHECVAHLQGLLGNLQIHAAVHDDTTRELNHFKALAAQREDEIRRLKHSHSQEVNAFKNDANALSEKIKRVKAEALEESARHASELSRAMKVLEERDEANEALRRENASLNTKLRRQETRTQQILGMLQQSDSQEQH
jgi:hypothetical protein